MNCIVLVMTNCAGVWILGYCILQSVCIALKQGLSEFLTSCQNGEIDMWVFHCSAMIRAMCIIR